MTTYILTYDLKHTPINSYQPLWDFLNSYAQGGSLAGLAFGRSVHHLQESVWLIKSEETAQAIFEQADPFLKDGDVIFITPISQSILNPYAGRLYPDDSLWLDMNLDSKF